MTIENLSVDDSSVVCSGHVVGSGLVVGFEVVVAVSSDQSG